MGEFSLTHDETVEACRMLHNGRSASVVREWFGCSHDELTRAVFTLLIEHADKSVVLKPESIRTKYLFALISGAKTSSELQHVNGATASDVTRSMSPLIERGWVKNVGAGVGRGHAALWSITDAGRLEAKRRRG